MSIGLLAAGLALPQWARAEPTRNADGTTSAGSFTRADFAGKPASAGARKLADWIARSRDNKGLPFVIVDKIEAKVFVFDRDAQLRGSAPALLGIGRGDDSAPGIGQRRLAQIPPAERTTPAGRFVASLGHDFEQDILWVDYESALSLHRVIVGKPADRRHARLASPTPDDNRISYGCINVPARFYDTIVAPAFKGTVGIVYILPETRPVEAALPIAALPLSEDNPSLQAAAPAFGRPEH